MRKKRADHAVRTILSRLEILGLLLALNLQARGQAWAPATAPTTNWSALVTSADGTRLTAATGTGGVYVSTNSGNTWSGASSVGTNCASLACSADGTKLVAAGAGLIYFSSDSAASWNSCSAPSNSWTGVAASADATKLLAVAANGSVYVSADSGNNWQAASVLSAQWSAAACSADGTRLVAVSSAPTGIILTSVDSGATWSSNSVSGNLRSVASSADGSVLLVAAALHDSAQPVYVSTNGGISWVQTGLPASFWPCVGCSADGTVLMAGAGEIGFPGQLFVSTNSGGFWSRAAAPYQAWGALACSADGSVLAAAAINGAIYRKTPFPSNWRATGGSNSWWTVASSASGNTLYAAPGGGSGSGGGSYAVGAISVSTNAGLTWQATGTPILGWGWVACSADARTVAAGPGQFAAPGPIYLSADGGAAWSTNGSPPAGHWAAITVSADGQKMVAVVLDGSQIYASTNAGQSWISANSNLHAGIAAAASADGTRAVVAGYEGGMFYSTNSGMSWWLCQVPASYGWDAVAASADGTTFIATAGFGGPGDGIWHSVDGGIHWSQIAPPPPSPPLLGLIWDAIACSADASKIVAACCSLSDAPHAGVIYSSNDSGKTWNWEAAPFEQWACLAASADGSRFIAAPLGDPLYLSQSVPTPKLNIRVTGAQPVLSWALSSTNLVLQQNPASDTVDWTDVQGTPTLNYSNLQYEIFSPLEGSQMFYRLISP